MDRSVFGNMGRSPYSSRTRQSSASSIVSGRKSALGSAFKKNSTSGRFSLSGRSNQSMQIVAHSEFNIVENYGLPLPVLVNEALTFSERHSMVSIKCSPNGWAWAVHGRRCLVWQYRDPKLGSPKTAADQVRTPQRRGTTAQCRELTLPHCDIGHKASLVTVFTPEGQQMASCLAVSPTGDARYWPSIAHDGSSIDCTGILDGQEFDDLLSISPQGYILVTTTCSLVLLQLQIQNGRHTIQHKAIKPPSGFFGGIGKKFASIIIGMNSNQDKENKFLKITGDQKNDSDWFITILADRWMQRWVISCHGSEQFLFEDHEFVRKIREAFQQKFWSGRDNNDIEVILLDMQSDESKLYLLAGSVNNNHTPQMHYAIVILSQENDSLKVLSFLALKLNMFYSTGTESECLQLKFIINRGIAYIYGEKIIYAVNVVNPAAGELDVEKIEFQSQNDKIMSAAVCSQIPLFFTKAHGLVCISPNDFDPGDFLNTSSFSPDVFTPPLLSDSLNQTVISTSNIISAGNLTMYELDPDEIYNSNKDTISQMKAAFIYHLKRNNGMCNAILKEFVPSSAEKFNEVDGNLDKIVISIAQDLADDIPAADPRWEQEMSQKHSLGSSSSLQIVQQLREKNLALSHFVDFLHATGLWEKLNAVTYRGALKSTSHMLSDINEKIIAGIALKSVHSSYNKILDEALQQVISARNEAPTGNLTYQDLFYVKVSRIQEIFRALSDICEKFIETHASISNLPTKICEINAITLAVLNEVLTFREHKFDIYALPSNKETSFEYLPWTAASGKSGLRDTLLLLISNTLKYGARSTGEPELRQKLYQQMLELIDFVLDGRKKYLESIRDNEKYGVLLQQYESQRGDLIYPLVEDEQYELAAKLAEKYLDFQTLVVICDRTQNQIRLDEYIERYKEFDFSQFAINWHLRQNKQGDLFVRFKSNQAALARFLGDHPSLAWVQLIFNGELERASKILFSLAQEETELIDRKKTMLSLSKLASLAADSELSNQIAEVNSELILIEYQEQLPESLLDLFGYDINNQKVLKPEEIINLFICEENQRPNEFDYRKALELLNHVEDPFEVRHKIWCSAILRDSWTNFNMDRAVDRIKELLFFKLIDLCFSMDGDLEEFLPPIEDFLNSPELGDLTANQSFQYLLKLGYEHMEELFNKK